jgi:glycosyltransferase involved in cell wall biosynthesis
MRRRPPLVATFHGVQRREYRKAALILRAADRVVCVSQDLATGLAGHAFPSDRLQVIRNAVPIPPPLSDDVRESIDHELELGERPVVSFVGRLVPEKAPHRFLAAAASIAAQVPDCDFLIVGDGPLRGPLEAEARELRVDVRMRFTGMRPDATALIARSDVIVFSSDSEGMSIAALEALAAGIPVVATDVPGMRELLDTGAGILTPRDADALAQAVVNLVRDPTRRAEMGRIGREKVAEEFSVGRMLRSYRELYTELASSSTSDSVDES